MFRTSEVVLNREILHPGDKMVENAASRTEAAQRPYNGRNMAGGTIVVKKTRRDQDSQ